MTKFAWLLLFFPVYLSAQTPVDNLVRAIDSISTMSFDAWKISPDLKSLRGIAGDPSQPGFDDSQWDVLNLRQSVYPDSCWLRKTITLPDSYLGNPVSGPVTLFVSVDDYGYLWVNGESKGHFPWDGEFEITKDARPGQTFSIAIKAINTGGPLRLLRAEARTGSGSALRSTLADFSLSLRVGQKLLGFDTYQTNARMKEDPKIDKSRHGRKQKQRLFDLLQKLAGSIDPLMLREGNVEGFMASVADVRSKLTPIKEFVKQYTLFFDANAHIDAAWLWREKETIEVCKNTFTSVFNMMDSRPDFTYTQSAAAYYDWMERLYPDVFAGIQRRVKEGRWEIVGGMWVEPDCNLPSGESWMRHLLYSKRYFREKFGTDVKIGWNPDSFGYNWNMPMFYAQAGIDAFVTQKIGWNERNVFPHRVFWWESPDGSRVLSYFPFDYVNTVDDPYRLVDWLRQFDANTGFTSMLILFGVGDHGGGPSLEMIDRIERLKSLDIYPTIRYGTATAYLGWLKTQNLSKVPVWKDELYLEYHQGTFTTQSSMKAFNRHNETTLTNAEKFATIATMTASLYDLRSLESAWRDVLFNQFHDILPGSGIREVYLDATERHQRAIDIGEWELGQSCRSIMESINTRAFTRGTPMGVFNSLSWDRTDVVSVPLPDHDSRSYAIFNDEGKEIPSQIINHGEFKRSILFIAKNVPAMGYAVYDLREQEPSEYPHGVWYSPMGIENEFFRVTIDSETGWLSSIVDKRDGSELLAGAGNELQILEDKPSAWDAWNIGLTGVRYPSKLRGIDFVESGPVRVVARVRSDHLRPGVKKEFPTEDFPSSFFSQDVILYRDIDRIDFVTDVDWWESKTMLKLAFNTAVAAEQATYDIPFGTIRRSTQWKDRWDSAKVEVPAQRWADVSDAGKGVSLLTRSKYGYDIKGSVIRLSLLRSPEWPDPTADRGKHSIEYALYPHSGSWKEARTAHRGNEYSTPLIAVKGTRAKATGPSRNSFIQLTPSNLILTTLKKAEDSDEWIVQWYDVEGKNTEARLTLPAVPRSVVYSNFLEESGSPVPFEGKIVKAATKKYSVVTVKVRF